MRETGIWGGRAKHVELFGTTFNPWLWDDPKTIERLAHEQREREREQRRQAGAGSDSEDDDDGGGGGGPGVFDSIAYAHK